MRPRQAQALDLSGGSPGMAGLFRKRTLAFSLLVGACGCQGGLQVFETMGEALKGTVTLCPWHERLGVFFEGWAESVAHARVSSITSAGDSTLGHSRCLTCAVAAQTLFISSVAMWLALRCLRGCAAVPSC